MLFIVLSLLLFDLKTFRQAPFQDTPYFLVICVEARHLDYGNNFIRSLAKHPNDWSKNGDVGHVWIHLKGPSFKWAGGQSGEGEGMTYMEGVVKKIDPQNPISFLNQPRFDGYAQLGSGGHKATFAAKFTLSEDAFEKAKKALESYSFQKYQLTNRQCTTFAVEIAQAAGIDLEHRQVIHIPRKVTFNKQDILLWKDQIYEKIEISSPDTLEKSLQKKVVLKEAEYGLDWVASQELEEGENLSKTISLFPNRLIRWIRSL